LKSQWSEPISWSHGWRDRSYTVPVGSAFGPAATGFFCSAVGKGSRALVRLVHRPLEFSLALGALLLLLVAGLARATWRPTAPLRAGRRRAWGQILAASGRMYVRRLPLFLGVGAVLLPISWLVLVLQALVLHATNFLGVQTTGESNGVLVFAVLAVGTALTLLGLGLVQAATARALVEIDQGRPVSPLRAYRLALDCVRPLFGALLIAAGVVSLLATSLFGIPFAVWLAGRWALIAPTIELEGAPALSALRRSGRLTRGRWLKVASLLVVGGAIVLAVGPLLGVLLILATDAPFWLVNVIAGLVYAVTMPFVALTTAYVYFDLRVRDELAPQHESDELPAEVGLA
jgi:hypothetical protein